MKQLVWSTLVGFLLTGCPDYDDPDADPVIDAPGFYRDIPAEVNRNVDVLFVVDNSGSMLAEQQQLAANFPAFINVLQQVVGGLPDLHIGVVSSNVGAAGQASVPGCPLSGDDGNLLTGPPGNTCASQFGLQGTFISDVASPGGARTRNFTGDMAQLFTCMASLGTSGCGFEMHLESMFRALQPGKNPGFYRDEAHLAVVFLADEDDCSVEVGTMFGDPNAGLLSELGPRTSFRCFEFGVRCNNDPNPRAFGTKTGCAPRTDSSFMFEVDRYVTFLRGLKEGTGGEVVVAGIVGNFDATSGEVVVGPDINNPMFPQVQRSCFTRDPSDPDDGASPPIRLQTFIGAFPDHSSQSTVCSEDLQDALVAAGSQVRNAIGNACIDAVLDDGDANAPGLQPTCTVNDVVVGLGGQITETRVRACSTTVQSGTACEPGATAPPCWCLQQSAAACPSSPSNLMFAMNRGGAIPAPGTVTRVYCRAAI